MSSETRERAELYGCLAGIALAGAVLARFLWDLTREVVTLLERMR